MEQSDIDVEKLNEILEYLINHQYTGDFIDPIRKSLLI